MVTLLPSSLPSLSSASASPNPNRPDRLLSLRPNTLALPSLSAAASRIRISSSFSATSVPGRDPRISDGGRSPNRRPIRPSPTSGEGKRSLKSRHRRRRMLPRMKTNGGESQGERNICQGTEPLCRPMISLRT
ncbi:unnamed protein product [Musa hybrid cultivar]